MTKSAAAAIAGADESVGGTWNKYSHRLKNGKKLYESACSSASVSTPKCRAAHVE
jgi:hypothetical protein